MESPSPRELNANAVQSPGSTSSAAGPFGMVDTGASASAGPQAAVQELLQAVASTDPGVQIQVNTSESARPYFRFGSGAWDRVVCGVWIRKFIGPVQGDVFMFT